MFRKTEKDIIEKYLNGELEKGRIHVRLHKHVEKLERMLSPFYQFEEQIKRETRVGVRIYAVEEEIKDKRGGVSYHRLKGYEIVAEKYRKSS